MTAFTFEGFTLGDPVAFSATQGPNTVSASVATWGQQPSGTATIDIAQTDTIITQFDSVRFTAAGWVDFDTPENHAGSGNIYKPRFHDIVYFWDTGKAGNFTSPENLLEAHKSRRYAHGPVVMVCYDQPGTYTVRLYAYEPATQKFAFKTTTVTVNAADSQYPNTQTICINPSGDSDFSAAPDGAETYTLASGNVFDENHVAWTSNRGGAKKRFLFKGGATYDFSLNVGYSDWTSGLMFSSYGSGRATIDASVSSTVLLLGGGDHPSRTQLFVNNLIFQGNYNPTTDGGGPAQVLGTSGRIHLVVHNVEIDRYGGTIFFFFGDNNGGWVTDVYHHLNELVITNPGGQYPILGGPFEHPNSSMAMTGCRVVRAAESDFDQGYSGSNGQQRAPVRFNGHKWVYLQGNEIFQNTGNQPCLKLAENGIAGGVHNLTCNTFEAAHGSAIRFMQQNAGNHTNLILRQNVMVLGPVQTGTALGSELGGQGCSVDSNLIIATSSAGNISARQRTAFRFDRSGGSVSGSSPNTVRSNTLVRYKGNSENVSDMSVFENGAQGFDITDGCNLEHHIEQGDIPHAPLEDGPASAALFLSRNTGRWLSGSFNTAYAADPQEIYTFRPEPGSPALGGRSNQPVYLFAIDAQTEADLRQPGTEDIGCWQGAV